MIKLRYLAASILCTFLCCQVCLASSCMNSNTANVTQQDLSWVKSETPIYVIDDTGLYATTLNSEKVKRLVTIDKSKDYIDDRSLSISADGKYIYFKQGKIGNGRAIEAYSYNVGAGKLTKIPQFLHEHFVYDFIGFSPDNQHLAWLQGGMSFNFRSPDSLPSIYVYSLKKHQAINFDYPSPHALPGKISTCFKPQWSQDGKSIYSNFINSRICSLPNVDEQKITYFKLDVATGATQKIAGGYEVISKKYSSDKFKIYYQDKAEKIPYRGRCGSFDGRHCGLVYGDPYVDGQSQAYIKADGLIWRDMHLYVQTAASDPVKVQSGTYSQCSGSSLHVKGWIENGKYLIYILDRMPYVYGVDEKRTAPLTHIPHPFGTYTWAPEHSAEFAIPNGTSQSSDGSSLLRSGFYWKD